LYRDTVTFSGLPVDKQKNVFVTEVRDSLKKEFGNNIYSIWLRDMNFVSMSEFEVVLSLPNDFVRDYVKREYLNGVSKKTKEGTIWLRKGIREVLLDFFPKLLSLELIVERESIDKIEENNDNKIVSVPPNEGLYSVGIDLNKNYTFENFVVGKSNKIAFETMKMLSESSGVDSGQNPLFLYGPVGIGKTHLCQSLAWKLKENFPKKNVVYISAEKFMYLFVQSCKNQSIDSFKRKFRDIDCLIVDDLQFIVGKEVTQKEFFYTFETLTNENKQVILACDRSPMTLTVLDEKLKSRLNGGLIVDIQDNERELTLNIIKKKCEHLNLMLPEDLIEYITNNLRVDTRQLEGFLKRLQINERIVGVKVTKELVDELLNNGCRANRQNKLTMDDILEVVCNYFSVNIDDVKSEKRLKTLVIPRHLAMYLAKELTTKSYPDIAKNFNRKNHATVLHACRKIGELIKSEDEDICRQVKEITAKLK
jgi:chromosomal replication initiator protein